MFRSKDNLNMGESSKEADGGELVQVDLEKTENQDLDVEAKQEDKLKYPRSIWFIVVNEFCERYCYFGMRAILVLYMNDMLKYTEKQSTMIYHAFTTSCYVCCIFGALIADSFLGKYRTILYLSILYMFGSIAITASSIGPLDLPARELAVIGLIIIAIGSGGIKPCVSAFGGDQFKLPEQNLQMTQFFSIFYFTVNAGALLSSFFSPMMRESVECFGEKTCYSLAFGVPAVLMLIAIFIFIIGFYMTGYKIVPSHGRMVTKVYRCVASALRTRAKERKTNPKQHWLDYAYKEHSEIRIMESKILYRICILFLPLPIFWGLFDQQGSTWIFQAREMNGNIGFMTITPDQMIALNPLLILTFIAISQSVIFPICNLIGIRRPLQKMVAGMFLASIAFLMAGILDNYMYVHPANSVHMLWQIPQYAVLALGEVLFAVTGIEFSYTESPAALKSIIQGCWQLTCAFGNIIVIIIEAMHIFGKGKDARYKEFYFFAGFIGNDLILFAILAHFYSSIPLEEKMRIQQAEDEGQAERNSKIADESTPMVQQPQPQ